MRLRTGFLECALRFRHFDLLESFSDENCDFLSVQHRFPYENPPEVRSRCAERVLRQTT